MTDPLTLLALTGVGFVAGFVDAVAGGSASQRAPLALTAIHTAAAHD